LSSAPHPEATASWSIPSTVLENRRASSSAKLSPPDRWPSYSVPRSSASATKNSLTATGLCTSPHPERARVNEPGPSRGCVSLRTHPNRSRRATRRVSKVCPSQRGKTTIRIADLLHVILHESGYTEARTEASTVNKIRRMVLRLNLSARDAIIWLGMLRQILWKVRS